MFTELWFVCVCVCFFPGKKEQPVSSNINNFLNNKNVSSKRDKLKISPPPKKKCGYLSAVQ